MQPEESNSVPAGRGAVLQPVIEDQAVRADRVAEVIGVEGFGQVDQLPVMKFLMRCPSSPG